MWFGKNNHTKLTKTAYGLSEGWKELSAINSGKQIAYCSYWQFPDSFNLFN